MSRRDAGYAFRAACPSCHGPLFLLSDQRTYFCANHVCGQHGAGRILTDDEVDHSEPVFPLDGVRPSAILLSGPQGGGETEGTAG